MTSGTTRALLVAGALCLVALAVSSLGWHMNQDSPILFYEGFLLDQRHLVPYRDFFDMNVPGAHMVNLLAGRVFGFTEVGFRTADLLYACVLLGLTWRVMQAFGRVVAWCAVVCCGLLYFLSGEPLSFQREYIVLAPILFAVAVLCEPRWPRSLRCALAGLCIGTAVTIKPQAAIALPLFAGFEWRDARRLGGRPQAWLAAACTVAGFSVPLLLAIGYLLGHGALEPFVDIAGTYWPLYNSLSGEWPVRILSGFERAMYVARHYVLAGLHPGLPLVFAGTIGAFIALRRSTLPPAARSRVRLLVALAFCFSLTAAAAGKFWPYHWFPFDYVAMMVSSLCLVTPAPGARLRRGLVPFALMLMFVALPWLAGMLRRPGGELRFDQIQQIASHLQRRLTAQDTVQPLDWTGGAVHAMLLANATPATRFLYDFHFLHHVSHPYIQRLREELMDRLRQAPPRFMIAVHHRTTMAGPDTDQSFDDLDVMLRDHYDRAVVGDGFTIWERRSIDLADHDARIPVRAR